MKISYVLEPSDLVYGDKVMYKGQRMDTEIELENLTLRDAVSQALIVGGHWHGGSNEQICNTIIHLCKAANERDTLRAQVAVLVAALESVIDSEDCIVINGYFCPIMTPNLKKQAKATIAALKAR